MKNSFLKIVCCLLLLAFVRAFPAQARPRPPILPFPEAELKSWKFDQPLALDAASLGAHLATNLWFAESWSGYADRKSVV